MKMNTGLWIDHRKAIIVMLSDEKQETIEIKSNVEKQPGRFDGTRSTASFEAQMVKADDRQERKFTSQLDQYYEEVVAAIRTAHSIFLFGPGEAKGELKNHLEQAGLGENIIAVETVDKMTDNQIASKVRDYFAQ